ncbi:multicopper oxidase family protein [Streptomyces sp. NBC_00151]|uniref:multicopper oxidase family protein n=1 Tax=Streptomyces sp. NBC_00151 TaxID=2975669 RepID=UPI002DDB05D9|nr:multicopper oxidase domain-containing protein [Streptomyces sp. NBC_00151]WRZ36872.1 multicopper oxidase domain-containing protein [Streptomyces sp. NBC_00151]WRZ44704.1 multicopper oxidase domain-containing protein [Streptomyces sp. NBC_00151]
MDPTASETFEPSGPNRRTLLRYGAMAGLGALVTAAPFFRSDGAAALTAGGPEPTAPELKLTKFRDPLRVPPVLRPRDRGDHDELTVRMRTADVTVHSEMPPVTMWTYEGVYPGPTIQTVSGRPLRIVWENQLTGNIPVKAVDFGSTTGRSPDPLSNYPGTSGTQVVPDVSDLAPWAAVHLHGMLTGGGNDGWMENLIGPGDVQLSAYPNNQAATTLWYHDHTHHVSRFSVYAGLAGLFLSRNEEEEALDLPDGARDVPLILSDRNFDVDESGALAGRLVHKVEMIGPQRLMRTHAAPYTLVNGVVWPYLEVAPRWYRFRIVNAANSRIYRLMLLSDGRPVPGALRVIGTDQGLIDKPLTVEGALNLSPGERADVLIDFSAFRGRALKLVNTLEGIAPGASDKPNDLLEPDVMQFRVADQRPSNRFVLPEVISPTFKRLTHHDLPHDVAPRWVVVVGPGSTNIPELWEMEEIDPAGITFPSPGTVQVRDAEGTVKTLRRTAMAYDDGRTFTAALGSVEIWKYLNLAASPHPMHIHLSHFQVQSRENYDITGFDRATRGSARPIAFKAAGVLEAHELGEKDVIRVGTAGQITPNATLGELVTVAVRFPVVGRGVHHCHMLEHEQHMMRPLVVSPAIHLHAGGNHTHAMP